MICGQSLKPYVKTWGKNIVKDKSQTYGTERYGAHIGMTQTYLVRYY